jgi:ABC-type lipoprotein release transport system permease subunit
LPPFRAAGPVAVLVATGLVLGIAAVVAMTQLLRKLESDICPGDPWPYAGPVVVLVLMKFLAGFFPTRRALQIDPTTALKQD